MKIHANLIDALGGGTEVAAAMRLLTGKPFDRERIYKWVWGVPWRWRPHIAALAEGKNVALPAGFLKADVSDAA